jgi:hypothetical protein
MIATPEGDTLFWISPDTWICRSRAMRSLIAGSVPAGRHLSFTYSAKKGNLVVVGGDTAARPWAPPNFLKDGELVPQREDLEVPGGA